MKSTPATVAEINRALYRKPGKRNADVETQLVASILEWLNLIPNVRAWRQNTGAMQYLKASGKKGMVHFGTPGMSDISGIVHGLRFECEVKRPGKSPTIEQAAWLGFIRKCGGLAFWCDSLDSCVDQLRYEFVQRGWKWSVSWEVR